MRRAPIAAAFSVSAILSTVFDKLEFRFEVKLIGINLRRKLVFDSDTPKRET